MNESDSLQFSPVTALAKANVYFGGKVLSHTIVAGDGLRRTLGVIFPGRYHFNTQAAEMMDIVAGSCAVTVDGHADTHSYGVGARFVLPANSGFAIEVADGLCEYVCAFLPEGEGAAVGSNE